MNFSIKAVTLQTGLTPHVIRVWERRYGAVKPRRTGTKRRLFSEADVERLNLLRQATLAGNSIGNVAGLSTAALRRMAGTSQHVVFASAPKRSYARQTQTPPEEFVEEGVEAVKAINAQALEGMLGRAAAALGQPGFVHKVAAPLAHRIGELWREGVINVAQEHFASAILRTFLSNAARPFPLPDHAPSIVVGTPAGQLHELGAIMISAIAAYSGWRVTYLGVSLPAEEIAGTAIRSGAKAVAISIVYPADDPILEGELARLRRALPGETPLFAGGRAARAYFDPSGKAGIDFIDDFHAFSARLDGLRKGGIPKAKRRRR